MEVCGPVGTLLAQPGVEAPRAGDADLERPRGKGREVDRVLLIGVGRRPLPRVTVAVGCRLPLARVVGSLLDDPGAATLAERVGEFRSRLQRNALDAPFGGEQENLIVGTDALAGDLH
jgi:hypothetical protein